MASGKEVPPMKSISHSEESQREPDEHATKVDPRGPTPTATEHSQAQENALQVLQKSPPKNGIPPKRPMSVAKRTSMSASTAASKPAATSTSRNPSSSGLSKPPARPSASSVARRPAAAVTAATAGSFGHKSRTSMSSVDDDGKGDVSVSDENLKSAINPRQKRLSTSGTAAIRSPAKVAESLATSRRSSMAPAASTRKPVPVGMSTGSPTKAMLRTATNSSQQVPTTNSTRGTRTAATTTKGAPGAATTEPARKKVSTIHASPAPAPASTAVKNVRPGLGTRKSTMSVTIEQRLREMEVVHKMLSAAMAEDGVGDDEAKEVLGQRADKTLANLKTKLEEARRVEGKEPLGNDQSPVSGVVGNGIKREASNGVMSPPSVEVERLKSALSESEEKVLALNDELAALQSKMVRFEEATDLVFKDAEKATEGIRKEHASKVNELAEIHDQDLTAIQAKLSEAENLYTELAEKAMQDVEEAKRLAAAQASNETAESLDLQVQTLSRNVQLLESQLTGEKKSGQDAVSSLEQLAAEVSSYQQLLDEEQQKSDILSQNAKREHDTALQDLNDSNRVKDQDILNLQRELQDLQNTHSQQLEEVESAASAREIALKSELAPLRTKVQELEAATSATSSTNDEQIQSKNQEIVHQSQVVEDLQNKLQQVHEVKEREIEALKLSLIQEHEKTTSKIRQDHESVLSALRDSTGEKSEDLALLHGQEIEDLEKGHELSMDKLQATLAELEGNKADSDDAVEAAKSSHIEEIEDYQNKLQTSEQALKDLELAQKEAGEGVETIKTRVSTLESERDQLEVALNATKSSMVSALEAASDELTSLKKTLETLGDASNTSDEQHTTAMQKIKDELNAAVKMLEEKNSEHSSDSQSHVKEVEKLRAGHIKEVKKLDKKNQEALRVLQKTYDTLLSTWKEAQKEHPAALQTLKTQHAVALKDQTQELKNVKAAHAKESEEVKSRAREIEDLKQQHETSLASLREEFEESSSKESLVAKEAHDAALSGLKSQLQKQTEILASTEHHLQGALAAVDEEGDSKKSRKAAAEMEEVRKQLAEARVKAAEDNEAIEKLTAAAAEEASDVQRADRLREEVSELTEQHAAEISKLHETVKLDDEKREKASQEGAEVRDRRASEIEQMMADLKAAKSEKEEHQRAMQLSETQAQDVNAQLTATRELAERLKTDYEKAVEEIRALQSQVETAKDSAIEAQELETATSSQKLEASQLSAQSERAQNTKLQEQLRDAEVVVEKSATRIREVESALKVTAAELVEMRTKRSDGTEFGAGSALHPSLWAVKENQEAKEGEEKRQSEELGPGIEGKMAGMQEQVRQLEGVNEDMLADAERLIKLLSKVTEADPDVKEATVGAKAVSEMEAEEGKPPGEGEL